MDVITYALCKKIAASAVSGVQSMSVSGQTLTINTKDSGVLTMTFPVPKDGLSVKDIDVNANNQIVFTMSDGTEFISGKIPTVKGDKGDPFKYSDFTTEQLDSLKGSDGSAPSAKIEKVGDTATITITDKDGTTTATIKDGQGGSGGGTADVPIEKIKVNGELQTPVNKVVDIIVPTVTNDLTDELKSSYDDAVTAKHTHDNGTVLDGITAEKVEAWDKAEENVQSDWNETDDTADGFIKNKPTIPSLDGYAKTTEIPLKVSKLENDSNYLSSIPEEYVTETELEAKGYLTEHQDISELENKSHNHDNKSVIDKFSVSDSGTLLFDGSEIKGSSTTTGSDGKSAYEIAIDNGFVGTETQWLESLKGSDGDNGTTPHIGENNNWFIGDVDTGILAQGTNGKDGKDGKSISTITKDDNNNIIVTFTDGSTQNIGKLSVDIQGDFLTSDGFGNLRYYNGHFQYYDTATSTWIDTSVTPSNVYIMNMTPQEMKSIFGVYDVDLGKYKLRFEEPDDTIIDGQVACIVEKVVIRRKLGSVPISETDGDLVLEIKRKDFGSYKNEYFVDTTLSPSNGDVYYYKAFPMSTTGFYNTDSANETDGIKCKNYNLYGFKIDQNESDPASMITYIEDNKDFTSAYMDYISDTFNYGDWNNVWFIKNLKPCILKYDGTVDYELDKNDYTNKIDGTDSDIANDSYAGNAMVGIPKVYWKIVNNGDNTANIYFSDKQIDDDFHCWSHIDNNGNEIDYCYMPIFNGSNVNSVLRSISGKTPIYNQTANTEITYAKSNNVGEDIIWYTELFNDRMLINLLLLLIGKSTDTQTIFGNGHDTGGSSASHLIVSGTMNNKGLFYGTNGTWSGVKVFGMEHWWGNQWRRIGGWINDKGTQKIKMTYGQSDGSTVDGYNLDGNGYITIGNSTPSGKSGGYISKMIVSNNCLIPTIASGSATTYYCDGLWFNNSQVDYAVVGGDSNFASAAGALCAVLNYAVSFTGWSVGSALSCKPLATT